MKMPLGIYFAVDAILKMSDPAAASYVGLTLEAAKAKADAAGVILRVMSRDGKPYTLTRDNIPGRITVSVDNGIVTTCSIEV